MDLKFFAKLAGLDAKHCMLITIQFPQNEPPNVPLYLVTWERFPLGEFQHSRSERDDAHWNHRNAIRELTDREIENGAVRINGYVITYRYCCFLASWIFFFWVMYYDLCFEGYNEKNYTKCNDLYEWRLNHCNSIHSFFSCILYQCAIIICLILIY